MAKINNEFDCTRYRAYCTNGVICESNTVHAAIKEAHFFCEDMNLTVTWIEAGPGLRPEHLLCIVKGREFIPFR